MTLDLRVPRRGRSSLAGLALFLSAFSLVVTLYSLALMRSHAAEASATLAAFGSGLGIAALAILVALVAMVVVWITGSRGGVRALFATALALAVLGGPLYYAVKGYKARSVEDVSTDLADPPRFDRAARDRGRGDRPVPPAAITPESADAQRKAYPELTTLRLATPADDVSDLAVGVVQEHGWRLLGPASYPRGGGPTGRIEAVASSRILGLLTDISIRIRPDGEGARVDVRAAPRLSHVDFGGSAKLAKTFLDDLTAAVNAAP